MSDTLVCSICGRVWLDLEPRWQCSCGGYLNLKTDKIFSLSALAGRPPTLWRYHEQLGIESPCNRITFREGFTPLVPFRWGGASILLKLDFLFPTGSFKDRGTTVMMSKLKEWGTTAIVDDSSGNAGASVAAYAAAAGIQADIFIPGYTSLGKAAQIVSYGANLVQVEGSREDTSAAALVEARHGFYASHNWSPHFIAGMKTLAYEITEQMDWSVPDWVVAPVGGGSLFVGLWLGFADLQSRGIVDRVPRLAAVQAENCAPIVESWNANSTDVLPIRKRDTAAEGIAISSPVRGREVLRAIYNSEGVARAVSEDAIWHAQSALASRGIYVEPTSAASLAGYRSLRESGTIRDTERVVVPLTGSGLKATDKILEHNRAESYGTVSEPANRH